MPAHEVERHRRAPGQPPPGLPTRPPPGRPAGLPPGPPVSPLPRPPARPPAGPPSHQAVGPPAGPPPDSRRPAGSRRGLGRARRDLPLWQELPLLLLAAFSLALLIKTFLIQAFFIPSGSMEQTLQVRDRVLVNKLVYDFREPRHGEVVVFRGTDPWAPEVRPTAPANPVVAAGRWVGGVLGVAQSDEKDFIKRVIGLPGDTVECCDPAGRVMVNGVPLDEPYVFENNPIEQRRFGPVEVPAGRLFVMGDHRSLSQDSRAYLDDAGVGGATVPVDQVIGRAFVTVWPLSHWRGLGAPSTFDGVPAAHRGDPGAPGRPVRPAEPTSLLVVPMVVVWGRAWRRAGRTLRE